MNHKNINELDKIINSHYSNITGAVILKNCETVYESYFNEYTADHAVHVYSVTKSVFSALIGIAIDKGYIKGVDQKILDFFPDYTVLQDEKTIKGITIREMLTMTAPYKYESEPYEEFFASENWVTFALDLLGGTGKRGKFLYSAIVGTHILSGLLVKATGQSVLNFANENLFLPLGIHVPKNIALRNKEEHIAVMKDKNSSGWVIDPQGINTAGWGLFLTPADMAKIGQLYLNSGMWEGKQIVPAWWVDESTKEHSRWGELPYGYLWWIIDGDSYAALGDGGNAIYVNTKEKLVVSIASLLTPNAKDTMELIKAHIEPMFI